MKRIDIKIGFECNNLCDFCAQGHKRDSAARKTPAQIRALLADARRRGIGGVVFTGGEPTMHPWLPGAVAHAKKLGFSVIQVQTNGRRFAYPDYCSRLKAAGVTEMGPSLHGASAAVHEGLTKAPGSFAQVVKGITNCKALGLYVLTNTVVTSRNYKDMPALAKLLVRLGVDQFQLAFVHMVGTAWEKRRELVPRKTDALPFMKEALDIGRAAGLPCHTEAVPFCLMAGYEDCVAERIIPEGPVSDADFYLESYGDYRRDQGKAKRAECRRCRWFAECEGPWKEYPELYGWDEFRPVPAGKGRRR